MFSCEGNICAVARERERVQKRANGKEKEWMRRTIGAQPVKDSSREANLFADSRIDMQRIPTTAMQQGKSVCCSDCCAVHEERLQLQEQEGAREEKVQLKYSLSG